MSLSSDWSRNFVGYLGCFNLNNRIRMCVPVVGPSGNVQSCFLSSPSSSKKNNSKYFFIFCVLYLCCSSSRKTIRIIHFDHRKIQKLSSVVWLVELGTVDSSWWKFFEVKNLPDSFFRSNRSSGEIMNFLNLWYISVSSSSCEEYYIKFFMSK